MGGICVRCIYPTASAVLPARQLTGLVALITGVTRGGLGYEIAMELAKRGAAVVLASRDVKKVAEARQGIQEEVGEQAVVHTLQLDVADLASIDRCVESFRAMNLPLNILIHNAGILCANGGRHLLSAQGIELTMATNYLGAFYLTQQLLPFLLQSSAKQLSERGEQAYISRIIEMSSMAHQFSSLPQAPSRLDSFFRPQPQYFDAWDAYAHSKLCQSLHALELSTRYDPTTQLQSFSCHPGIVRTTIGHTWYLRLICCLGSPCFKTVQQGAATPIYLACAPSQGMNDHSGEYFANCAPERIAARFRDAELSQKLWQHTSAIVDEWKLKRSAAAEELDEPPASRDVLPSSQIQDESEQLLVASSSRGVVASDV